jgi:hypothetical protein
MEPQAEAVPATVDEIDEAEPMIEERPPVAAFDPHFSGRMRDEDWHWA